MTQTPITQVGRLVCAALCIGLTAPASAQNQATTARPQLVQLTDALLPDALHATWRSFIQLAWNGNSNEIERVRLKVFDPLSEHGLYLSWKTAESVVAPGILDGSGVLEWRSSNTLAYGGAGLEATFDGTLVDGKFDGPGRFWHRSGTVYQGGWTGGLMEGHGYLHLGDGRSYKGGFKAGHFDGQGELIATDGTVFSGQFLKGQRHGVGQETTASGMRYSSFWHDGKEDLSQRQIMLRPEDLEPTLAQQLTYSDIGFGVTVDRRDQLGAVTYQGVNESDRLVVFPGETGFMQNWRSGGQIIQYPSDLIAGERFRPANLLMSLENRGGTPVQVLGGYLAVQSSTPDLDPYLEYTNPFDCGEPAITEVNLFNYGWSDPQSTSIEGGFISRDASRYLLAVNVSSVQGWPIAKFDVGPGLVSSSPALASLATNGLLCQGGAYGICAQSAAAQGLFGPLADGVYTDGSAIMADYYGIVSYSWRDHRGQTQQKQSSIRVPIKIGRFVEQNECGEGDGYDSPFPNPFVLPIDRTNYRFPFSLFATLQPGTVQNWNFQIDAEQASRHVFSVVLQLSDGREVASRSVDLTYFKAKRPW